MLISICIALTGLQCSKTTYVISDSKMHVIKSDGSVKWFTRNTGQVGEFSIDEWKKERIGKICIGPIDAGKDVKLISKLCENNPCTQEERERIEQTIMTIRSIYKSSYDFKSLDEFNEALKENEDGI